MNRALFPNGRSVARLLAVLALVSLLPGGLPPCGGRAAAASSPTATATTVVSLVAKGDDATAERYFSPALQAAAPAERLRQIWEQLTAQLGAFERQTGATEQTASGIQNVFVHCLFAQASADVVISVDSAGKVAGLHLANMQP